MALNGTKTKANASKHEAMSYEGMKKQEAGLAKKAEALLHAAAEADAGEEARYGKDKRGDELPEERRRAESRIARIRAEATGADPAAAERELLDAMNGVRSAAGLLPLAAAEAGAEEPARLDAEPAVRQRRAADDDLGG